MRKITIERIEVEGFKCFNAPAALDVGARAAGLHFVRGDNKTNKHMGANGAGKSTLISDAPTWCLYGKTVSKLKTTDIRAWQSKKAVARVALHLAVDGVRHIIERTSRSADLSIDGKTVGQQDVVDLIGLDFTAWEQAVVWGQGRPLFFDLEPREKMQLLSDALKLERWERRGTAAGARASDYERRASETRAEIEGLARAASDAQAAVDSAKAAASRWGAEHAERVTAADAAARAALKRRDNATRAHGDLELSREKAELELSEIAHVYDKLVTSANSARREETLAGERLRGMESKINEIESILREVEESGRCPTCGQELRKKTADAHVDAQRGDLDALEKARKAAKRDKATAVERVGEAEKRLAVEEDRRRVLRDASSRIEGELRLMSRTLGEAVQALTSAQAQLQRLESEENPHREAASAAAKRLRDVRADIKVAEGDAEKFERVAERAKFWSRGFRDIRLMVVDDLLDDLRATTADVLADLGMSDWEVIYATERETKSGTMQRALTVSVRAPHSSEAVRWESWSGGEQQRLRLAGAAALSASLQAQAGVHIDFRVLDEPTRGLSAEGVPDLCETLADYAEADDLRIFFVDHMARDSRAFASTITITRDRAGAAIKED